MSSVLRVACPHCLARLKLKSREMLGRRVTCPKCRETFDAAEEDEELFQPAELPPQQPSAPMISRRAGRRKKRSDSLPAGLGWFAAGIALTAMVVGAFFVPWSSLVPSLVPEINFHPFADTPDTIMTAEMPLLGEMADLGEAAFTDESFQELAAKAKNLDDRFVDLYLRAVRVRPVSRERLDSIAEKHRAEMDDYSSRTKTAFQRKASSRRANGVLVESPAEQQSLDDLKSTFSTMTVHLKDLNRTFTSMMEKPPAPQSKSGKTQLEIINDLREVVVLVSRVDSSSAAQAARPALEQHQERLDNLKRRIAEEMAGESAEKIRADLVYERIADPIRTEIAQIAEVVAQRYDLGSDFQSAVFTLAPFAGARRRGLAESRIDRSRPFAGARTTVAQTDDDPPAADPPATSPPTTPSRASSSRAASSRAASSLAASSRAASSRAASLPATSSPAASPSGASSPATPAAARRAAPVFAPTEDEQISPADPPFAPPNTSSGGFIENCFLHFGKGNVFFIGFPPETNLTQFEVSRLMEHIRRALGGVATLWTVNEGTIIAVASAQDMNQLARKIHVGHIRKIDVANRRMIVDRLAVVPRTESAVPRGIDPPDPLSGQNVRRFRRRTIAPPGPNPGPAAPQSNTLRSSGL